MQIPVSKAVGHSVTLCTYSGRTSYVSADVVSFRFRLVRPLVGSCVLTPVGVDGSVNLRGGCDDEVPSAHEAVAASTDGPGSAI